MSLPAVISLYAANTVDGGQIVSISPTLSRQRAVIRRASSAQSTYRRVSRAAGIRSTLWARNSGTSVYGASGASVMARWMSHRKGASAWQTATAWGGRADGGVAGATRARRGCQRGGGQRAPPTRAGPPHRDPRRPRQFAGHLDRHRGV